MGTEKRITVLFGAGAMMETTTLSCKSITENVIATQQGYFVNGKVESVSFLKFIYEKLKVYYQKEAKVVNFEDIFHTLEMLRSLETAKDERAVKSFRSVFGMLCDPKDEFSQIPGELVYAGMGDLVDTVIGDVAKFENDVYKAAWFSKFFMALQDKAPLDIFTLNYDTWLEQILENYNDGFVPMSDCETHKRFSANQLFSNPSNLSTINHLHGQICFTTHLPTGSSRFLTDGWYKANSYEVVKSLRISPKHPGYMARTQAAEQIFQYPIITGLRKNDKILNPPFDAYYTHFYQQLRTNKNLLIVGYGFGDLYINTILKQFRELHGSDGKVICIGYLNPKEWIHNLCDMELHSEMKQSIYRMFNDSELPDRFLGFEPCDCIDSSDENSKLYLCGFETAVNSYGDDILSFFET